MDWGRAGLVGASGFVGGVLSRQRTFDAGYTSRSIADIAGERFDTVVCAGAPAAMWKANADPDGDWANRVSASRLWTCAEHMGVPIGSFFPKTEIIVAAA